MKYFVRSKAIAHPGKYFKAKSKEEAFEMVQKEMREFLEKADVDDLVVDITEDIKEMMEEM